MKKIAFISDGCYVHIDFNLFPLLDNNIKIGWFPYFASTVSRMTIDTFLNKAVDVKTDYMAYMQLSNRMKSKSTYHEFNELMKKIQKWNPDDIYVNADGFPWLPFLIQKYFDINHIVAAIHDVKAHTGATRATQYYKQLLPMLYKNLNTYSLFSFEQLKEKYPKKKNISCCMHPLLDYGEMIPKEHDKTVFMFFGNFVEYKGIDLLLEAGAKAYSYNHNIKIKICGNGKKTPAFEQYASCPVFEIVNRYIEDYEIPNLFSDVDCLVLPYKDATQSGPMMIALNYGIRVLASDILPFRWFKDRFIGVTTANNTVEQWARALAGYSLNEIDNIQYEKQIDEYSKDVKCCWNRLFGNS